jgi:tetratricopeptide (TPR) repeat protein
MEQARRQNPPVSRKLGSIRIIFFALAAGLLFAVPIAVQAQQGGNPLELQKKANELQAVGKYAEAIPYAHRALEIEERRSGPNHPNVALLLNNLALLYDKQGRYADAEPLYLRSLAIEENALGPDHPEVATSLSNLASLYNNQGRYADAEPLFKRALEIREKALGPDDPNVATSLNNLAVLYNSVAGISRPSAFAVVRLMTRSNLVGCSIGMSAGLVPRRTLSTNSAARR